MRIKDTASEFHFHPGFSYWARSRKNFNFFDIYIGGENLTNFAQFTQDNRIAEYWKPYHTHFVASMV